MKLSLAVQMLNVAASKTYRKRENGIIQVTYKGKTEIFVVLTCCHGAEGENKGNSKLMRDSGCR